VDFRNTIIAMTSNVGAEEIRRQTQLGFTLKRDEAKLDQQTYDEMRKKLLDALRKIFRPEFVNRVDAVIVFHALSREQIARIVDLELDKVVLRLKDHQLSLRATDEARKRLGDEGYDPEMGARPLRRVIQNKVEDRLSDALLAGEFKAGDHILVDLEGEEIVLKLESREPEDEAQPA
jgi:ATP-dependent Clp protease ATP-binding subunit ClpC